MDRRRFLKLFASAAPVAAVAPTYFFAPKGGWTRSPGENLYRLSTPIFQPGTALTIEMIRRFQRDLYERGTQFIDLPPDQLRAVSPWT